MDAASLLKGGAEVRALWPKLAVGTRVGLSRRWIGPKHSSLRNETVTFSDQLDSDPRASNFGLA